MSILTKHGVRVYTFAHKKMFLDEVSTAEMGALVQKESNDRTSTLTVHILAIYCPMSNAAHGPFSYLLA